MIVTAFGKRHGLRESLDQYAARHGVPAHHARPFWRTGAVVALGGKVGVFNVFDSICRIAPGFTVPTRNPFETGWP